MKDLRHEHEVPDTINCYLTINNRDVSSFL